MTDPLIETSKFLSYALRHRGPASQLERSIERISQLPKTKQRFVLQMIDTVLVQSAQ